MTKTCGECKHFMDGRCFYGDTPFEVKKDSPYCDDKFFEPAPKPTNGDKIRQGGDDELIDFADGIRRRMCHYCVYSEDKSCVDKAGNCWEGVRAWLNAPAESEGTE